MSGSSTNLVVEAELTRQRRIAEWQQAAMHSPAPQRWKIETGKPAPLAAGTNLLGASYDDAGALLPQAGMQGPALGGVMSQAEQYRQSALSQQAQNMPDIQQAVAQALGALAVLSECSLYAMGQSLIGIGAFVDPVAEPVVVASSKPVNPALARAMGCGSRQPIGFMVR